VVDLLPMTAAEFDAYKNYALDDYTRDGKQGTWPSAEIAQEQFNKLLPEGLKTPNQHLLSIKLKDNFILLGFLWLTVIQRQAGPEAFILDFVIFPEFRRQGYGTDALLSTDRYAASVGVKFISLNVFSHNEAAHNLYLRAGFIPTNIRMTKKIAQQDAAANP
jgi:RimJ/RimL family protein N-acetyltransferase